jgi:hypothetical protein
MRVHELSHRLVLIAGMATALFVAVTALPGCSDAPPSWDRLLSGKITDMYPSFHVTQGAPGNLQIERPGQKAQTIEVAPIALLCQRGPKECDYAVDQMLLSLRAP